MDDNQKIFPDNHEHSDIEPLRPEQEENAPLLSALNESLLRLELQEEQLRRISTELGLFHRRFRELFQLTPMGCILIDPQGRVEDINAAGTTMLGLARWDVIDQPLARLVSPESRRHVDALLHRLFSGLSFSREKLRMAAPGGNAFFLELSGMPEITLNGGKPGASLLLCSNVSTCRKPDNFGLHLEEACMTCDSGTGGEQDENVLCAAREKLRHLSHKTMAVLENERKIIAREIHDSLGGSLAAIKFLLEDIASRSQSAPELADPLDKAIEYIQGTIKKTKRISAELRPTTLDDLGLEATVNWFCRRLRNANPAIAFVIEMDIDEEAIDEPQKIVLYRITQEAMINAVRHSSADTIQLSLVHTGDRIELLVKDNGCGMETDPLSPDTDLSHKGYGLIEIREKAEICGGAFLVQSTKDQGTLLRVSMPLTGC